MASMGTIVHEVGKRAVLEAKPATASASSRADQPAVRRSIRHSATDAATQVIQADARRHPTLARSERAFIHSVIAEETYVAGATATAVRLSA